jgi:nucleoside-diphosphate-sugar epimerase
LLSGDDGVRKPVIMITGANGEIGHGLIDHFGKSGEHDIIAIDLNPIDKRLARHCAETIKADILDSAVFSRLVSQYEIHTIYHLAALLSTRAEYSPLTAHQVNVEGTLQLIKLAHEQAEWRGKPVKFIFPSSIAVYGLPDLATKIEIGAISEAQWNFPITMYGCNKLYCEQLGRYYAEHYRQLSADRKPSGVDFRALRFPGLISAFTQPSGGTSDFAPEMIHAAAQGKPYACFVVDEAQIPFMVMPDAIKAMVSLAAAPVEKLSRRVYNVSAFSLSAGEIRKRVLRAFPDAEITFKPDPPRAKIVDSWPEDADDTAARRDWNWSPEYDVDRAFDEYLVPNITRYYREREQHGAA